MTKKTEPTVEPRKPKKENRQAQPLSPRFKKRPAPRTAFKKGHPMLPGAGRPVGSVNKVTKSVKDALTEAFDELGGVPSLVRWARMQPTDFYKLWSRLLPIQITGNAGGPIVVQTKHDLSKLSVEELTTLANLVDKATMARAEAGEVVEGGVSVRLRAKDLVKDGGSDVSTQV